MNYASLLEAYNVESFEKKKRKKIYNKKMITKIQLIKIIQKHYLIDQV